METIRTYIENMFAALPDTPEVRRLKNDLLAAMEDKYNELKATGKTENEAIGIVISEFGNIEELTRELNVEIKREEKEQPGMHPVSREEAEAFLIAKRKNALWTGIGVVLCILAPAVLVFITFLSAQSGANADRNVIVGVVLLLGIVAVAVGVFIFSEAKLERYKYMKDSIELPLHAKSWVESQQEQFGPTKLLLTIFGVIVCVLSPVPVILTTVMRGNREDSVLIGVVVLLLMVAVGVFLLVYAGTISAGFDMLLQKREYSPQGKKAEKLTGAIASVWWPVVVCIYLAWSFLSRDWHWTWIVWPIAGIAFGAVAAVINVICGVEEN